MRLFFESLSNTSLGAAELEHETSELLIGRSGACDVLIDKPCISRRHLSIKMSEDGTLQLCDLYSTLGTTVDDVRLLPSQWQTISKENKIVLGRQVILRIEEGKTHGDHPSPTSDKGVFPLFLVKNERKILQYFETFKTSIQEPQLEAFEQFKQKIISRITELAAVVEVGVALSNIDDYFRVLNFSIDMALKVTKAQRGAIVLLDEDTQKLETVTHRSIAPKEVNNEMNTSKSILLRCLKQNKVLIIQDTKNDQELADNRSIYLYKIKSVAVAPLRFERKLLGVLYLDTQGVACEFPERIEEILKVLAAQISLAINNARLFHQATKDVLTGIANRRFFLQRFKEEVARARRHNQIFSVVLLDIDHFKRFNDTHGHDIGDIVLENVAKALVRSVRIHDLVARFGGEEFIILLTDTNAAGAKTLAEKVRSVVEQTQLIIAGGKKLQITISLGVTTVLPHHLKNLKKQSTIIKQADLALYQAKENGRNQVQVFQQEEKPA